jgi:hypothetical protein
MIGEPRPKGFSSCLWCDLRFNIHRSYSPGSENELVDIESFSDGITRAEKTTTDSVVIADARGVAPHPSPQDEASPEFTRDLEGTIQREKILLKIFLWSKCMNNFPRDRILLPWSLPSKRALVLRTGENC